MDNIINYIHFHSHLFRLRLQGGTSQQVLERSTCNLASPGPCSQCLHRWCTLQNRSRNPFFGAQNGFVCVKQNLSAIITCVHLTCEQLIFSNIVKQSNQSIVIRFYLQDVQRKTQGTPVTSGRNQLSLSLSAGFSWMKTKRNLYISDKAQLYKWYPFLI